MSKYLYLLLFFVAFNEIFAADEARILRFPNSSESEITFSHAGDIYVVPISGGLARRITSSEGIELMPRFSNDGNTVAFVGEYDGQQEIYSIAADGGSPKRLTFQPERAGVAERMGPNKIIMGFDAKNDVFYRSRSENWHIMEGQLYTVSLNGGISNKVDIPVSGYASLSPDGKKMAYNRLYREFRTWKRYRGGQVNDVWIYDFANKKIENVTNNEAQDIMPMWAGNKIYFMSDRDKVMNIFSYDLTTKQTKKVTNFTDFDTKYPSLGKNHIAFENGGYVYLLNLATEKYEKVNIQINEDFPDARTSLESVSKKISAADLSIKTDFACFIARGDLFVVNTKTGKTTNLTETPGIHEREAAWSPDGNWIAYISDKTGENEVYIIKPDGSQETQLTQNAESYRYALLWSPDSKMLLNSDKAMKLNIIDINTKKTTEITKSKLWEIRDFSWSPDSRWVAYSDQLSNEFSGIYIYNLENKTSKLVTSSFFQSMNPVFTPNGNYLLFTSKRNFAASISEFEWNFQYGDMTNIYGLALRKDGKSLFTEEDSSPIAPEEKKDTKDEKSDKKKDEKKAEDKSVTVTIDFDGIENRIFEFPTASGNYWNLFPTKDHKLFYNRASEGKAPKAYIFDVKEKKESEVSDIVSWGITNGEEKILLVKDGNYYVEKYSEKFEAKNKINTDNLKVKLDRQAEWKQVYNEAWRQMRDFFYDPNMHNVDWKKVQARYAPLIPHIKHRTDLTYIIGEMIAELNVGHAYVGGGDMPKSPSIAIGLLGADYELKDGKFAFKKIFKSQNWEDKFRSPLNETGVNVKEGDYLISIDGKNISETYTPFMALEDKVNQWVKIKVANNAKGDNAKEFMVKTRGNDEELRYYDWVESRRAIVDKATNGKVGYVHIPDMGVGNGLNEFAKYYFSQTDKEALIIDDRYNGGGNVSPMVIERLKRTVALARHVRNQEGVNGKPDAVMTGPLVCLINEYSMSDGDLFPYQFKAEKLGKLIGKRSWGGVIGIRGSLPLLDGSYLMRPEFSHFSLDGRWVLENEGMSPDIEVDNMPDKVAQGIDEQLNKGIEVILEEIKTNKKPKLPSLPPFPKRD